MKITFNWIRGDDEFETLIITDDNDSSVDLSGSRFDLHIVPDKSPEVIKLSTSTGEIVVNQNEITFHVNHDVTKNAQWRMAKWDLQQTTADNIVRTLCGGNINLKEDVTKVE